MLPLPNSWRVRCSKCGHTGIVTAATADLAIKPLRCVSCGHRQAFAPESIAPLRPSARKPRRWTAPDPVLNDRLDDLIFAG